MIVDHLCFLFAKFILDQSSDGLVPISSITYVNKRRKHDKETRLASIKEGRDERDVKFGHRVKDPKLGRTNREKLKTKSFMMIRHKVNKKHKRSFKDKQVNDRSHGNPFQRHQK